MIVKKITTGFVIQTYDTEMNCCIHQEFVAGDQVEWEDEEGTTIDDMYQDDIVVEAFPYQPFDMVQNLHYPNPPKQK